MAVVYAGRHDVLVQFGKLTLYLVAGGEHQGAPLQCVVYGVASSVRHPAVGVGVARAPCQLVGLARVLARQLGVVGGPAAVVVLRAHLIVRLCVHSRAVGVSVSGQLVEDVFPFQLVVARFCEQGHVEQGSHAHVVVVLVVGGAAQIVAAVMGGIVHAKEVVGHVLVGACLVGIVHASHHAQLGTADRPLVAPLRTGLQVAPRVAVPHAPVVVQTVVGQRHCALACDGFQCGTKSAAVGSQAAVEPHPVCRAALGVSEILPRRCVVPVGSYADGPCVSYGYVLGIHLDKTSAEVGRIFRAGRFDNQQIVYLAARDDVEGEGAGIGLRTRCRSSVYPYIVVPLREAAHHHKLVFYQAHARHAPDDLAGVGVLCAAYLLSRHVAHHHLALLGLCDHGALGVAAHHARHLHLSQCLAVGHHLHAEQGVASCLDLECHGLVRDILHGESVVLCFQSSDYKSAVYIAHGACALGSDRGTHKWFTGLLVHHRSFDVGCHHSCYPNHTQRRSADQSLHFLHHVDSYPLSAAKVGSSCYRYIAGISQSY